MHRLSWFVSVVLVALIATVQFASLSNAEDDMYDPPGYAKFAVGAWIDNFNRTVYVCINQTSHYYITWSRPSNWTQITSLGKGVLSESISESDNDDFKIEGDFYSLIAWDAPSGPIDTGSFWMKRQDDHFEGRINGTKWVWKIRLYSIEPAASICLKPAHFETAPKLFGVWQRSTSTGDFMSVEICPDGSGRWQLAFATEGGKLRGNIIDSLIFWGQRDYFHPNYTRLTNGNLDLHVPDSQTGGQFYVQTGASILTEVAVYPDGTWKERQTFSYVSKPENCGDLTIEPVRNFWFVFAVAALPLFVGICFVGYWLALLRRRYSRKYPSHPHAYPHSHCPKCAAGSSKS
eukprot:TRINITY_DN5282_c0_g1_i4.p1 TRINITY_DN5282_c0_g1~~TRINITY_DN5282_c0_g1_i4.p1  ORF type:complete len:347 (+),score=39.32 TRINITY_DN5282_c0_g1_i4:177-1217(+)